MAAAVDGPRPFTIPAGSPLASGWGARLAQLLERHGLHEVLDLVSAYAELRCRHEPDSHIDHYAERWLKLADPAFRRIDAVAELAAAHDQAMLRASRMPLPSRIRGGSKKALKTRIDGLRDPKHSGRPRLETED